MEEANDVLKRVALHQLLAIQTSVKDMEEVGDVLKKDVLSLLKVR